MSSPTQKSLEAMRKRGFTCEVTEHWNPFAKIRKDLFGFIDILCLGDGKTIGVQTTTFSNMGARKKKILGHKNTIFWLKAGNSILLHGWKKTTKTVNTWVLVEHEIIGK